MLRRIGRSVKFCNRHKCNRLTLSRYFRIRRLLSALSVGVPVVIDQYCAFMKHVSYIQCNVSGSTSSDALYRLQYHSVCQLLQLISPIAWTLCKDAVCCYWSSVVCVCMSVCLCLLVTTVSPAKRMNRSRFRVGVCIRGWAGPRPRGGSGSLRGTVSSAMRPLVKILRPLIS